MGTPSTFALHLAFLYVSIFPEACHKTLVMICDTMYNILVNCSEVGQDAILTIAEAVAPNGG